MDWLHLTERGSTREVRSALRDATSVPLEPDRYGYTLLHRAALRDDGADLVCRALLPFGFDPNTRDTARHGQAALHYAASEGRLLLARVLLDAGADANLESTRGGVPLHFALHFGATNGMAARRDRFVAVVRLLVDAGTDLAWTNGRGQTLSDVLDSPFWSELLATGS